MKRRRAARRRVRYELGAVLLLVLVLGLFLWLRMIRDGRKTVPTPESDTVPEMAVAPETAQVPETAAAPEASPTSANGEMFQWKPGRFVYVEYGEHDSNTIDESIFATPEKKTAADLVAWAQMAWDNRWGYVWGTFGTVLTEEFLAYKIEQFGDDVKEYEDIIREKWMGRRVVDCAGLIKSYGWYVPGEGVNYDAGDMPDWGTQGFFDNAAEKGPIDTLPETPGLLVYSDNGHIGVYIGDGWAIEAISHAGGVVKTRVADRPWTHWLKCPYIEY